MSALIEVRNQIIAWDQELRRAADALGTTIDVRGALLELAGIEIAPKEPIETRLSRIPSINANEIALRIAPFLSDPTSAAGPAYKPNPDPELALDDAQIQIIAWIEELGRVGEANGIAVDVRRTLGLAGIGTKTGIRYGDKRICPICGELKKLSYELYHINTPGFRRLCSVCGPKETRRLNKQFPSRPIRRIY
ncbi:hypothetical protein CF327_g3234 [Tilletia walkeri]|nr:hypothetical protein CF327_g3234 [Tilletia walkeri]